MNRYVAVIMAIVGLLLKILCNLSVKKRPESIEISGECARNAF